MRLLALRVCAVGSLLLPLLAVSVGCSSSDDDDDSAVAGSSGSSGQSQAGSSSGGSSGQVGAGSGGTPGQGGASAAGAGTGGSAGATPAAGLTLAAGADAGACVFASQTLGEAAATCVVTLTNQGTKAVTFAAKSVAIAGADAAVFSVATPPSGSLAAGASTTMTVAFLASDEGVRTATLTVASDSSVAAPTLALKGTGACPTKPPVDLTKPLLAAHCTQTLYVAVGDRTRRLVSTDLMTWSHDQLDHTSCLTSKDGTFNCGKSATFDCSVKDPKECKDLGGDALDCSFPDAADPTKSDCTGFDDGAFNAAFGRGLIVTASDFGIFTSADAGATWTRAPAPAPQQWNQGSHVGETAYGNGVFVVANGGTTYTSADGYAWTKSTDKLGGGYYGFGQLLFGGGHFVAAGAKKVKVTEDGTTWHDSIDLDLSKLAYGNGLFVGGGTGIHGWSVDGTNWQTTTDVCAADKTGDWTGPYEQCIGGARGLAWDGKRFVMCGTNCVESTDGKTWKGIDGTHRKYGFPYYWMDFHDGAFFGSGSGTNVATSTDLIKWTTHDFPTDTVGAGHVMHHVSVGAILKPAKLP